MQNKAAYANVTIRHLRVARMIHDGRARTPADMARRLGCSYTTIKRSVQSLRDLYGADVWYYDGYGYWCDDWGALRPERLRKRW